MSFTSPSGKHRTISSHLPVCSKGLMAEDCDGAHGVKNDRTFESLLICPSDDQGLNFISCKLGMSAARWSLLIQASIFLSARSRSSSARTSFTFTLSAAVSPTAHCGSPQRLWMTARWRPCSYASSQSESCKFGRGTQDR